MVVGDSETGRIIHFQIFYHICEFLSGRRTLGVLPDIGDTRLDIIPCDYVAEVIARSSRTKDTVGQILHECSGSNHAILISELKKQVREIFVAKGKRLPRSFIIPLWMFKAAIPVLSLLAPLKARRAMRALPVFFDYLRENQSFANENTKENFKGELKLAKMETYIEKILTCYLQSK